MKLAFTKLIQYLVKYKWLVLIILVGGVFRFTNLYWGEGYFFHPDERNIAYSVSNIDFLNGDFNPDFFAYGTFPIYLIRLLSGGSFDLIFLFGRGLSALLSTLIIPISFSISRKVISSKSKKNSIEYIPVLIAISVAFTPGLIQFAHFLTFEIFLTFFYLLIILFSLTYIESKNSKLLFIICALVGASIATKVVSLVFLPIPIVLILADEKNLGLNLSTLKKIINVRVFSLLFFSLLIAVVLSPFNLIDFKSFISSMNYEGPVANGSLVVFYTQQFIDTVPVLYQLTKVFPYILGVPFTIIGFAASIYYLFRIIIDYFRVKNFSRYSKHVVILLVFWLYALSHFSFYVKWTRYMIPLLPLLVILSGVLLDDIYRKVNLKGKSIVNYILYFSIGLIILQGINFTSIYLQPDPRVASAKWAMENISSESKILTEIYDIGIIAWEDKLPRENINLFNFYDLDAQVELQSQLQPAIDKADYIVLMSDRIYPTKSRLSEQYPIADKFYSDLFEGRLGFKLVKKFNRPTITERLIDTGNTSYYFTPDETFKVFDRPEVMVFERE